MFSGFKNLFKSNPKKADNADDTNKKKDNDNSNSQNTTESSIDYKTGGQMTNDDKIRFMLAMDVFKLEDPSQAEYDINIYDTIRMFETFFGERLRNWK